MKSILGPAIVAALALGTSASAADLSTPSNANPAAPGVGSAIAGKAETKAFLKAKYVATGDLDTRHRSALYDDNSNFSFGLEHTRKFADETGFTGKLFLKQSDDYKPVQEPTDPSQMPKDQRAGWSANWFASVGFFEDRTFAPSLSYEGSLAYKGGFEDYDSLSHTVTLGADWTVVSTEHLKIVATPSVFHVFSDKADKKETALGLTVVTKKIPVFGDNVKVEGILGRHDYDKPGVNMTRDLLEKRAELYVGAKLKAIPNIPWGPFGDLELGVRYIHQDSNSPDLAESFRRAQFTPSISLKSAAF